MFPKTNLREDIRLLSVSAVSQAFLLINNYILYFQYLNRRSGRLRIKLYHPEAHQ